jgi:hypothetical protein
MIMAVLATNRDAADRIISRQARPDGICQAVSKGMTKTPASVMAAALPAATKIEGICWCKPLVVRSRVVVKSRVASAR